MSVTIAGIEFDNHSYDERGDVLYVDTYDYTGYPADADATPEGHGIEWDENGNVVAMTLVNVRRLIERDGNLRVTWPDGHVTHDPAPQRRRSSSPQPEPGLGSRHVRPSRLAGSSVIAPGRMGA